MTTTANIKFTKTDADGYHHEITIVEHDAGFTATNAQGFVREFGVDGGQCFMDAMLNSGWTRA